MPNQPVGVFVPYEIISDTGPFPKEWLRRDTFGKKIVDGTTGEVFPHLKVFWDKVNHLTVEQATVFLEQQLESDSGAQYPFLEYP